VLGEDAGGTILVDMMLDVDGAILDEDEGGAIVAGVELSNGGDQEGLGCEAVARRGAVGAEEDDDGGGGGDDLYEAVRDGVGGGREEDEGVSDGEGC